MIPKSPWRRFEAIEGIYCPPLTLKEHEWYCTHVLNLHKETKSSWDELFFDLALVAAFGSLASCLTLSSEDGGHHRRLSSGDVHMSFPRGVFILSGDCYCDFCPTFYGRAPSPVAAERLIW